MVTAQEFKGEIPANVRVIRTDNIPKEGEKFHKLCGKTHAKKECKQQCYGCKMYGSHLPQDCWELYPDKKPKFTTPRKNRKGRGRERSRSKSEEKGEKDKKDKKDKRENSPTLEGLVEWLLTGTGSQIEILMNQEILKKIRR